MRRFRAVAAIPVWFLAVGMGVQESPATGAEPLFQGSEAVPLGSTVAGLTTGDFNGDGTPDVAVTHDATGQLSVLISDPGGLFEPPVAYAVGTSPVFATAGDLDGRDGVDLFVVNSGSSNVSVLLNRGDGSFRDATEFSVGIGPRVGQLADFNGDGHLDAVTSNFASFSVNVLRGDGQGGFPENSSLTVGDNPHFVVAGDFDLDGLQDIAVAHRVEPSTTGAVSLFRGLGNGEFEPPLVTDLRQVSAVPRLLATGDFNRDGLLDLGVYTNDRKLLFLENRDGGAFDVNLVSEDAGAPVGLFTGFLVSADFNRDGALDLVAPLERFGNHGVRAHLGNGDGTFGPRDIFFDGSISNLALEDLDRDGLLDAVVSWEGAGEIALIRGVAPGRLAGRTVLPLQEQPRDLEVVDFDGDGRADLAALGSGRLELLRARGDGRFDDPLLLEFPGRVFQDLLVADTDGGGMMDVALTDFAGSEVVVAFLDRAGRLGTTRDFVVRDLPDRLAGGDLDGDGLVDLAVAHQGTAEATVILGPGVPPPREARQVDLAAGSSQTAIEIGDVDGDGRRDVVVATRDGIRFFFGDGGGGFPRTRDLTDLSSAAELRVVDLLGDGAADLVAPGRRGIVVLHDVGRPEPPRRQEVSLDVEVRPLEIVDVDADGHTDLVTASPRAAVVFRGEAGGSFALPEVRSVGSAPRALVLAELDGDGVLDLATADFASRSISILHGTGAGQTPTFRRGDATLNGNLEITDAIVILNWLFTGGPTPRCMDAADSDDDGKVNLTDAIRTLFFLFGGGPPPAAPGPGVCGADPTADGLPRCRSFCP